MDHPKRGRITRTQWLLIVIIAALITNAVLQTILIMQRDESTRIRAGQGVDTINPQDVAKWIQGFEKQKRHFEPLPRRSTPQRPRPSERPILLDRRLERQRQNEKILPGQDSNLEKQDQNLL
jgi:hypothetical protein